MITNTLQQSQKKRTTLAVFAVFFVGVLLPLFLIFGTGFWHVFSEPITPKNILIFLVIITVPPILASRIIFALSRKFAAETFDPLFAFLKLNASPYLRGRQYHGIWKNRQLDIYLHPLQRQRYLPLANGSNLRTTVYNGHMVEFFLESNLGTHFAIATGTKIPKILRSTDEKWSEKIASLKTFNTLKDRIPMITIEGLPKALCLKMHLPKTEFSQKAIESWVADIYSLARQLETLSKPSHIEMESIWEKWTRSDRKYINFIATGSCFFTLLILLGGIALLVDFLN
jgi:hypothetical protein